jgi:MFS family permease
MLCTGVKNMDTPQNNTPVQTALLLAKMTIPALGCSAAHQVSYREESTLSSSTKLKICLWLFAVSQLVSIFADRLKQLSLVGLVGLVNPGSSAELLQLGLVMHLPMLLFAPLFGALLDRWNKSSVILFVDLIRAGLIVLIPSAFAWSGSIYPVYFVVLFISLGDLLFSPARSALIPLLSPPEKLIQVNAVFWGLGIVGTLGGFLLTGWFFDYRVWQESFYGDAVAYAAAGMLMLPVLWVWRSSARMGPLNRPRPPRRRPTVVESIREVAQSIRDGFRLIKQNEIIAVCLIAQSCVFGFGGIIYVIGLAHVQEVFPPGKTIYLSVVSVCLLAGLLLGSWIAGYFRNRTTSARTIAVAALLSGVAVVGVGRTDTLIPMCIWTTVIGLATSPVFIFTETLLQRHSPDDFRGRVFATREVMIKAAFLATSAVAAGVNTIVSKSVILMAVGLFLALLGVLLERMKWLDIQSGSEG